MPFSLVDVHCHVHGIDFDADRPKVLEEARAQGVLLMLTMGEGYEDNQRVLRVAAEFPHVLPCLGLHPERAPLEPLAPVIGQIRSHASQIVALGEVGLDFWIAKTEEARTQQKHNLQELVALAKELDLPLSIHSRSAGHYVVDLLASCTARRVDLHAFDGAAKHAQRALDLGYFFSIPPSVVRSQQKQKLVRHLPLEAMMLESDAPVLGPDPKERNVPANLVRAAAKIAEIKSCTIEGVLEATSHNAWRFFSLERFASRAAGP
jgi:TatD DNase family protein